MTVTAQPSIQLDAAPLLVHAWVCPYVQRVTLALAHKKVPIKKVEIDLTNKPDWLGSVSPHLKVPAISYLKEGKQQVLYESIPLVYWANEYYANEGPDLLPASPEERVKARIIISRFDSVLVPKWYNVLRAGTKEQFQANYPFILEELAWLETQLNPQGPYFLGASPSIVDTIVAPHLLRNFLLQHYKGVDPLEGYPALKKYLETYKADPAVLSTFLSPGGPTWEAWTKDLLDSAARYAVQDLTLKD